LNILREQVKVRWDGDRGHRRNRVDLEWIGSLRLRQVRRFASRLSNRLIVAHVGLMRITSGGQTGADRAALDFAIAHGLPHGGWCPKGRLAEDGIIPERYQLSEMPTSDYPARTVKNVQDSDGTVIISIAPVLTGGSLLTLELARQHAKPVLHLHWETPRPGVKLEEFITEHHIQTLNVAGPRVSMEPSVVEFTRAVLEEMWIAMHVQRPFDFEAIPEFGKSKPRQDYQLRPGAYAVISGRQGLALVRTPGGLFLPGGGVEKRESLEEALGREVFEECGLEVTVGAFIGTADELCKVRGKHVRKRCSFFWTPLAGDKAVTPMEADHELVWMGGSEALAQLTHESQRWALRRLDFREPIIHRRRSKIAASALNR
jgi:ADP-ribose pyrophosphatase YjhB (NUDIX family)